MNNSGPMLLSMAYLLGLRHGFDLDHLATIDAITRTQSNNRSLSQYTGLLFSLGHGLVVIAVSLIVGSGLAINQTPNWLEGFGSAVSIFFLFLFGGLTLWSLLKTPTHPTPPVTLSQYITKYLLNKNANPIYIALIGVLFAFSFDTVSQVVLFSLTATALAGWAFSGLLGVLFMFGMMTSDGLNGLFVSKIIQHADKTSITLSRLSGVFIAAFSIIVGIINCMRLIN